MGHNNLHKDLYSADRLQSLEQLLLEEREVNTRLHNRIQEVTQLVRDEREENSRLRKRNKELEVLNKKYHINLQRFAPGEPTVQDY